MSSSSTRVLTLTKEYPPHVYGGAGVHVENLTRELSKIAQVDVRCFGDQQLDFTSGQPSVAGFKNQFSFPDNLDPRLLKALEPLAVNLGIASQPVEADVVHCHTWYSMMAGFWIKTLYGIPLVVTTHSLEPLRPWKEEQLGRGYHLSSWMEKTVVEAADAVIAVSEGTRAEVMEVYDLDPEKVHVIYNGIDLDRYQSSDATEVLKKYGVDPSQPYLLFVGRITKQKGILHLIEALHHMRPGIQAVLCAGMPDTEEIGNATANAVKELQKTREGVHWIPEMVPIEDIIPLYSGASVFVCPSVYEPFGIINLEAMACKTPVVASAVGGIPEVVVDGETGYLVSVDQNTPPDFSPVDPAKFAQDLAAGIHRVLDDPDAKTNMGLAGRKRVEEHFSWASIAKKTLGLYESLCRQKVGC